MEKTLFEEKVNYLRKQVDTLFRLFFEVGVESTYEPPTIKVIIGNKAVVFDGKFVDDSIRWSHNGEFRGTTSTLLDYIFVSHWDVLSTIPSVPPTKPTRVEIRDTRVPLGIYGPIFSTYDAKRIMFMYSVPVNGGLETYYYVRDANSKLKCTWMSRKYVEWFEEVHARLLSKRCALLALKPLPQPIYWEISEYL
jgi:hypothetical protein